MVEANPGQSDEKVLKKAEVSKPVDIAATSFDSETSSNSALAAIFKCLICDSIPAQPTQDVNCNKFFCKGCIREWQTRSRECPQCRQTFQHVDKMDLNLKTMLDQIEVDCGVADCGARFKHELLTKHYEKECISIEYRCKQGNCQVTGIRGIKGLKEHAMECNFNLYECPTCEEDLDKKQLSDHDCIKHMKQVIKDLRAKLKETEKKEEKNETTKKCGDGHYLQKLNVPKARTINGVRYNGESLFCNDCRKSINVAGGYYTCTGNCDWDQCIACYNQSGEPKVMVNDQCYNGHPLNLRHVPKIRNINGMVYQGQNVYCNRCRVSINVAQGEYTCNANCDEDVCKNCFVGGMTNKSQVCRRTCAKGHTAFRRHRGFQKYRYNGMKQIYKSNSTYLICNICRGNIYLNQVEYYACASNCDWDCCVNCGK